MDDIRLALKERILVLDGAMGTVLQSRGLQGNSELFNLTSPGVVEDIHSEYIKAGSDIISTNSFGANKISQAELGFADKAADMADSKAADNTNVSIAPISRLEAGMLLESQNKKDEALKIYQDIKAKYVTAALVQSGEIDKYIERASTK